MKYLIEYLIDNGIPFLEKVDLKKKTWIHRGGMADIFIQPKSKEQLASTISFLYKCSLDFLIVGHTSNLYIRNTTNIPIVVSTLYCSHYSIVDNQIECEAGVSVIKLAKDMVSKGIKGFEYITGLPGTVGAALVNNSSCKSNSISALLVEADIITPDGRCVTMTPTDFAFDYRTSAFKEGTVKGTLLSARLRVEQGDAEELKSKSDNNEKSRSEAIEENAKNLGCTVNSTFSLGPMPWRYKIVADICDKIFQILRCENPYLTTRRILCFMSGCSKAFPYISPKNVIIYMWLDENADEAFPYYLKFMKKIYKTESLEIQVI